MFQNTTTKVERKRYMNKKLFKHNFVCGSCYIEVRYVDKYCRMCGREFVNNVLEEEV